jgi:O-antigen/teichoic acid export membrane protein
LVRQGFGRALFPILVAPLGLGWGGLVAGEAAGRLLGLGDLLKTAGPRLLAAHRLGARRLYECLVRYRQFPLTYVPGVVLAAIASALPLPLMASLFGVSAAGAFALAQRVILLPSSLICSALADVYQARLVDAVRRDPHSVRGLVTSSALRLALLGIVMYLPIAGLALVSFPLVFGAEWAAGGAVAAALAPLAVSGVVTNPLSRAIFVSRVPQWKLVSDAVRLTLPAAGLYLSGHLGHSMVMATLVYSLLSVFADGVYLLIILHTIAPFRQRQLA